MSDRLTSEAARLLFNGVREKNLPAVTSLVTKDHRLVRCINSDGWTALIDAAYYGHADICLVLLAHGAAVTDIAPGTLFTPLHMASQQGHTAVVEILIQHQASHSAKAWQGFTPLHIASEIGHLGCVVALCSAGADKTAVNNYGDAAIHLAAGWGRHAVVVALLDQGCGVDMVNTLDSSTPLMYAAMGGHVEVARTLLARGADADKLTKAGETALALAIDAEDVESVELLAPVTSNKLGHSLVLMARSQLEITAGIKSFITKCGGERDVFLDGVREATQFANLPLLQALLHIGDKNWLSTKKLYDLTNLAIMSDNSDMCETILSLCGEHRYSISQHWVRLASERKNVNIQKRLDPEYQDLLKENKENLRDQVTEKKAELLNQVPKSEEFPYFRTMDQVLSLLDGNDSIRFEDLLANLRMPKVHYKCGDGDECPSDCKQKEKCEIVRQTVQFVKLVTGKLGEKYPLFKDLSGALVGSLKENTRCFGIDEVDFNLSFPKNISKALVFNAKSQAIECNKNKNKNEKILLPYKEENNELNGMMIYKDFVSGLYETIQEIELPAHLTMDPLTTSYTPCLSCMKTDMVEPECKRCHHKPTCQAHNEECGCEVYTSPSLTHSKIGIVLHLQWTMPDGSKKNVDCDVNCPNLSLDTPYDGGIDEIQKYLRTKKPVSWLEEYRKLEDMSAVSNLIHVTRSVRLRLINRQTVLARQALLFLGDNTLSGRRRDVYVLIKILKTCTASKASSYKVKYAVDMMLSGVDPEQIGMGQAVRRVMEYRTIKNKFGSIHPDLEREGYTGVKVTNTGFRFIKNTQVLNDDDIAEEALDNEDSLDDDAEVTHCCSCQ